MATAIETKPAKPPLSSTQKCAVEEREGGAVVHFRVDPQTWARLSRRMNGQDPATYMWENILHRAVETAAY
jgi:hypothetical protein